MPLPLVRPNEKRKDYMQRCMNDRVMIMEYKDANQRLAVCSNIYSKKIVNICLYNIFLYIAI